MEDREVQVPVHTIVPGPALTRYSTDLLVQSTEHDYILTFFEVRPPLQIAPVAELTAGSISPAEAEVVARIVVAQGRMPDFVAALQDALQRRTLIRASE